MDSMIAHCIVEQGYTVQPLLDSNQISSLMQLYRECTPEILPDFYVSAFIDNEATRRRIFEGISNTVGEDVKRIAPGYRLLIATYVTKRANSTSRLGMHQDWTYTYPSHMPSINIWCPLCNVDEINGCLMVIPNSHKFGHICATTRNPGPFSAILSDLDEAYALPIPMSAGEALLFDTRVLHASDKNVTGTDRVSLQIGLIPEGSTPLVYVWDPETPDKLYRYGIDTEVLLRLAPNTSPTRNEMEAIGAIWIDTIDYVYSDIRINDLPALGVMPVKA